MAGRLFFSRRVDGPARGIEVMAVSAAAGLLAYAGGFLIALDPDNAREACFKAVGNPMAGEGPRGALRVVEGWLPLSRDCRWADGTRLELVPLWLNVVVFTAPAGVRAADCGNVRQRPARGRFTGCGPPPDRAAGPADRLPALSGLVPTDRDRRRTGGQPEGEHRTGAGSTGGGDGTSVGFHQLADDGQPETAATGPSAA